MMLHRSRRSLRRAGRRRRQVDAARHAPAAARRRSARLTHRTDDGCASARRSSVIRCAAKRICYTQRRAARVRLFALRRRAGVECRHWLAHRAHHDDRCCARTRRGVGVSPLASASNRARVIYIYYIYVCVCCSQIENTAVKIVVHTPLSECSSFSRRWPCLRKRKRHTTPKMCAPDGTLSLSSCTTRVAAFVSTAAWASVASLNKPRSATSLPAFFACIASRDSLVSEKTPSSAHRHRCSTSGGSFDDARSPALTLGKRTRSTVLNNATRARIELGYCDGSKTINQLFQR